ncbi:hypothetical protein [Mycobacterium sp. Marseille-P9652]|uniref:hypothetical protein n=1 Tax=Mycobacterium sp. Marseille-P9652 TaxID=2654950 RepID=UPI0012E777B6|nr:hypothetical protein [Mycobacterium sp. Marseille-P9652]
MEVADAFLPGTSANADWYREIQAFFLPRGINGDGEPPPPPDTISALEEIRSDGSNGRRPTAPESSRFIYGLGAAVHLINELPDVQLPISNPFQVDRRSILAEVFALTGGKELGLQTALFSTDELDRVQSLFIEQFKSWRDWPIVSRELVQLGVLAFDSDSVPLCNAAVINYKGIEAVVVDAKLRSKYVSLNDLAAVVDPRNWSADGPSFFCSMVDEGPRPDHWHKVLETVGYCDINEAISPRLVTMLKFHKLTVQGSATHQHLLDYDLNDPVPDPKGDGKIDVDNGFIDMQTEQNGDPNQPPVLVRVRKVCHINGLRPYTQKMLVCIMGYAAAVEKMLFGSARQHNPNFSYVPWDDSGGGQSGGGSQQQGGQAGQQPPPDNSVASTAISMVADCVKDLAAKQYDLTDKWLAGQLTVADLAQYSADVGARIASDPWKFIQAISQPKGGGK